MTVIYNCTMDMYGKLSSDEKAAWTDAMLDIATFYGICTHDAQLQKYKQNTTTIIGKFASVSYVKFYNL